MILLIPVLHPVLEYSGRSRRKAQKSFQTNFFSVKLEKSLLKNQEYQQQKYDVA